MSIKFNCSEWNETKSCGVAMVTMLLTVIKRKIIITSTKAAMNYCIKRGGVVELFEESKDKPRIPRPPNAFMLYANENRKKMSQLYPTESNKDISKRLGSGWKSLDEDERKKFFERAKAIGLQHKKEYPDYVYNPKEARIRKAMRDATRERSIGTSPMLPRPNARRASSHSWVSPHDELLMSPQSMGGMRGGGAMCSPFPMPSTGSNQFMGTMNGGGGYNAKMEPSPMPTTSSVHTNYMQSNPLAQLQQHTEMWPDYHQNIRPRSSGNPYMMGDVYSPTPTPTELTTNSMMMEKPQIPPPTTPTNSGEIITANEPDKGHGELIDDSHATTSVESTPDPFMHPVFETQTAGETRQFEKIDESKMKKSAAVRNNTKKTASKPLPDFNEAFGSTERGRFQSPPDPRLAPNKGYIDYFFDNAPIKFDDYQI